MIGTSQRKSVSVLALEIRSAIANTVDDFNRNDYLNQAAALSYYFLLSFFPLLIFFASMLAYIPVPNLFNQILDILAVLVPRNAMGVVTGVLDDVLETNPKLLSVGIAGAIFAASNGFSVMIDVLNLAYDVPEGRPYWKKRLLAIGLTLLTGVATVAALIAIVLGPEFGTWLARHLYASRLFAIAWPYIRWSIIVGVTIVSVELIYFIGPNVRQRFRVQLPGAMLAVLSWIAASWGLNWYLRRFAHYNKTFGALGAVVALMLWLYVSGLALILGAEVNCELLKAKGRALPPKESRGGLADSSPAQNA